MINQIKNSLPNGVSSPFNPIISLNSENIDLVNEKFILPILKAFFLTKERGGIENFSELDPYKLITEKEFSNTDDLVKSYIYKEIIDEISKKEDGRIDFKPKYVITFDESLTKNGDLSDYDTSAPKYPYKDIFGKEWSHEKNPMTNIKYGVIRLGEAPILYYIYIDLQQLIKFIKNPPK